MTEPATRMVCHGCGFEPPAGGLAPPRCPQAREGDDVDHVLVRRLDPGRGGTALSAPFRGGEANPFVRYRSLLHAHNAPVSRGLENGRWIELVERLDARVRDVWGTGFEETPFGRSEALARELGLARDGAIWVKNETGNVSGSHKSRHLMGLAIGLEATRALDPKAPAAPETRLAIASCGNAALAAAVVAKAAGSPLDVFIPPHAEPAVVARLADLGARLVPCPRLGRTPGDPCYLRFREAVAGGAYPFTCQGNENGFVIEGGATVAYEMVATILREGRALDHLVVQVGGGALASACLQALDDARALGLLDRLPRFHAVQTRGAYPLSLAWRRVAERVESRLDAAGRVPEPSRDAASPEAIALDAARARRLAAPDAVGAAREGFRDALVHRSSFMTPWEEEPRSVAGGILDDETYDWAAIVQGMLASGGVPVVVSEEDLVAANALAKRSTGIPVDPTGSSGLAGVLALRRAGVVGPAESVGVIFTGVERSR